MSTRHAGLRHKAGLARIRVGHIQLATRALRLVLCHRALRGSRNDRSIVGAHYVYNQLVARSINTVYYERLSLSLSRNQCLN